MTTDQSMQSLYRDLILDHARAPRNFGRIKDATHSAQGINPLCGDKLHLYLKIANDRVVETQFEGTGCAISVASASLLTEIIEDKRVADVKNIIAATTANLDDTDTAATATAMPPELRALEGVKQFPSRVKCATLAWQALLSALLVSSKPATTE